MRPFLGLGGAKPSGKHPPGFALPRASAPPWTWGLALCLLLTSRRLWSCRSGLSPSLTDVAYADGGQRRSWLCLVHLSVTFGWHLAIHTAGILRVFCPYCCASYSESLYSVAKIFCSTVNSRMTCVCLHCLSCMD